jgi:hypothetical protein
MQAEKTALSQKNIELHAHNDWLRTRMSHTAAVADNEWNLLRAERDAEREALLRSAAVAAPPIVSESSKSLDPSCRGNDNEGSDRYSIPLLLACIQELEEKCVRLEEGKRCAEQNYNRLQQQHERESHGVVTTAVENSSDIRNKIAEVQLVSAQSALLHGSMVSAQSALLHDSIVSAQSALLHDSMVSAQSALLHDSIVSTDKENAVKSKQSESGINDNIGHSELSEAGSAAVASAVISAMSCSDEETQTTFDETQPTAVVTGRIVDLEAACERLEGEKLELELQLKLSVEHIEELQQQLLLLPESSVAHGNAVNDNNIVEDLNDVDDASECDNDSVSVVSRDESDVMEDVSSNTDDRQQHASATHIIPSNSSNGSTMGPDMGTWHAAASHGAGLVVKHKSPSSQLQAGEEVFEGEGTSRESANATKLVPRAGYGGSSSVKTPMAARAAMPKPTTSKPVATIKAESRTNLASSPVISTSKKEVAVAPSVVVTSPHQQHAHDRTKLSAEKTPLSAANVSGRSKTGKPTAVKPTHEKSLPRQHQHHHHHHQGVACQGICPRAGFTEEELRSRALLDKATLPVPSTSSSKTSPRTVGGKLKKSKEEEELRALRLTKVKLEKDLASARDDLAAKVKEVASLMNVVRDISGRNMPAGAAELAQIKIQYEILAAEKQQLCMKLDADRQHFEEELNRCKESHPALHQQLAAALLDEQHAGQSTEGSGSGAVVSKAKFDAVQAGYKDLLAENEALISASRTAAGLMGLTSLSPADRDRFHLPLHSPGRNSQLNDSFAVLSVSATGSGSSTPVTTPVSQGQGRHHVPKGAPVLVLPGASDLQMQYEILLREKFELCSLLETREAQLRALQDNGSGEPHPLTYTDIVEDKDFEAVQRENRFLRDIIAGKQKIGELALTNENTALASAANQMLTFAADRERLNAENSKLRQDLKENSNKTRELERSLAECLSEREELVSRVKKLEGHLQALLVDTVK